MPRRLLVASLWVGLSSLGCAGAAAEEGEDGGRDGSGSGSGGLGDCDVHEGKDEYLACVCDGAKPCQGISPAECPSLIRSTLKFGQHDAGLDCVQAIGDFYECQFGLTCTEFDELGEYWSWCWEGDPGGAGQPYCRRETLELVEVCNSFEFPCNP